MRLALTVRSDGHRVVWRSRVSKETEMSICVNHLATLLGEKKNSMDAMLALAEAEDIIFQKVQSEYGVTNAEAKASLWQARSIVNSAKERNRLFALDKEGDALPPSE